MFNSVLLDPRRIAPLALASCVALSAAEAHSQMSAVEFRAKRASVELRGRQVELNGDVQVRCGRYRLNAEFLRIGVQWDGVHVDGPGQVTLCECQDAPISFAFDKATIRPPSDLIVSRPALQINGTRVLWLPALWLRSPERLGLLAPRFSWRGSDGFVGGFGVHVPLDSQARSVLDVYISGYAKGGFELEPTLHTKNSRTRVRWDRLHQDLVDVTSDGAVAFSETGLHVGWSADLVRGARGLGAVIDVTRAARRYDEVRAYSSTRPAEGLMLGGGIEGFGTRGASSLAWGPVAFGAFGGGLGRLGGYSIQASSRNTSGRVATQISRASIRAEMSPSVGPIAFRLNGLGYATSAVSDSASRDELRASGALQASVPLRRRFAAGTIVHVVEPLVRAVATGMTGDSFSDFAPMDAFISRNESLAMAGAGFRSTVGRSGSDSGVVVDALVGNAYPNMDTSLAKHMASGNVGVNSPYVGIGAMGAYVFRGTSSGGSLSARARIGATDSAHLALRVGGYGGADPVIVRGWHQAESLQPWTSFFDRKGTSLGGDLTVPLPKKLLLTSGADYDVEHETLLSTRGGIGYRHPCGCIGASGWVSHRVGRDGVDAWVTVDLAPR